MRRSITLLICLMSVTGISFSQPEDFYREVDLIVWVVNDVESVAGGWKNLGFRSIKDHGNISLSFLSYKGRPAVAEVRAFTGFLGGARILWIQPFNGESAFSNFLKKNGNGVFALMHNVPEQADLSAEIHRLNELGVNTLQTSQIIAEGQAIKMTIMQTGKKGKYALGFLNGPLTLFDDDDTGNDLDMQFNQFAFAIKPASVEKVSAYWELLGFPAMEVTHGGVWEKQYYGKPADFDMELGWYRYGNIVYEWCIPLRSPTVYEDHINKYGEGFQHFGFSVEDMDEAISYFQDRGYKISMSGGWGEKGQSGSGRFAYVDTESIGGETIELLWNYKE